MYVAFYDFNHDPFPAESTAPPLYVPPSHSAAVARIMDGIAARQGCMALLGEAGMGKTSLLCARLAETDPQQLKVVYLSQADVPFELLVQCIYEQLGFVAPAASLPEMLTSLQALIREEDEKGRNVVLVIDDAHTMPFETLSNIRLLSDSAAHPEQLLQIVLVAQPHFEQQLHLLALTKAGNPFTTIVSLERLSDAESVEYIQTHLADAQEYTAPVLSKGAVRAIATATQGVPQRLQRACREVLVEGYRSQLRPIPPRVARRVLAGPGGYAPRPGVRRVVVSAASVVLVAAGLIGYGQRRAVVERPTTAQVVEQQATTPGHPSASVLPLPQETSAVVEVVASPQPVQQPVEVAPEPSQTPAASTTSVASMPADSAFSPGERLQEGAVDASASGVQQAASFVRQAFPNGGDFQLKVWAEEQGKRVYRPGERLVVHVAAETAAYLQVDYYQADGQVVHLLPNPLETNRLVPGQTLSLGEPGSSFQFTIMPPFGAEMLMVVASQQPFAPSGETPNIESAAAYIPRLRQNLQAIRSHGKVAVAHLDLLTQKP
jgi:general secretion pathway protein A